MEQVTQSMLALLIAISGALHQGLEHLRKKEYEPAIQALTQVIDAKLAESELTLIARYYRAVANVAKGNKTAAQSDLKALLQSPNVPATLASDAQKLYGELTNDFSSLLPEQTPEAFVRELLVLAGSKQAQKAIDKVSESYRQYGIYQHTVEEWAEWLSTLLSSHALEWVKLEWVDGRGLAAVVLSDGEHEPWRVDLVQEGAAWKLQKVSLLDSRRDPLTNFVRLRHLGIQLTLYASQTENRYPPDLKELTKSLEIEPSDLLWVETSTGEESPFVYRPGLTTMAAPETLLAAAPRPIDNKRLVLKMDGSVEEMEEALFVATAREQEWRAPNLVKKEDLTEDDRLYIASLITQLAADDHDKREAAREALMQMREAAEPLLREHVDAADPEVRLSVREILLQ